MVHTPVLKKAKSEKRKNSAKSSKVKSSARSRVAFQQWDTQCLSVTESTNWLFSVKCNWNIMVIYILHVYWMYFIGYIPTFFPFLFTFDFFHFDLTIIVNEANHSKYSFKRVSALKQISVLNITLSILFPISQKWNQIISQQFYLVTA